MELLQLKYFCDAAQTQSFTATAKKFGVPSSGISQTIKRLERELGTSLFSRSANRIFLNEQGRIFLKAATHALSLLENAKREIHDNANAISGEIRILILTNRRIVTEVIERFKSQNSEVDFFISHKPIENISDCDFIISDDDCDYINYEKKLLLTESFVIAINKSNPLSGRKSLTPFDVKNERFITMQNESSLCRHTKRICQSYGFEPNITIQSDDPFYIRKYVDLGLGIALVPEFSWKGLFSDNVEFLPIENYKRNTYIFCNTERYRTHAAQAFLDMLLHSI